MLAVLALLDIAMHAVAQAPQDSPDGAADDRLGIKKLRPAQFNDVNSPLNPLNYEEAKANAYLVWPDPLTFANHTDAPSVKYFISWADRPIGHRP